MGRFFTYITLEWKRAFLLLPQFFLGGVIAVIFVSVLTFSVSKILHPIEDRPKATIALVMQESSPLFQTVMAYVKEIESVSSFCSFEQMEKEEALRLLDSRRISAVFLVPERQVESILDGTNLPIHVLLPSGSSLTSALILDLTNAGGLVLRSAQAGVYSLSDIYKEQPIPENVDSLSWILNLENLQFFASREELFCEETVSATGDLTVRQYYLSSSLAFCLLLLGIPCAPFLKTDNLAFQRKLAIYGLKNYIQIFVKASSVFLLLLIFSPVLFLLLFYFKILTLSTLPAFSMSFFFILLFISFYTVLLFEFAPTKTAGIYFIFLFSLFLHFLSGGFLPSPFFPSVIENVGSLLPSSFMIKGIGSFATAVPTTLPLFCYSLICYLLSVCIRIFKKEDSQ
ncbi:ABC transporter permease [bacterium 1XD42-8]|nr:ABC transporter permease [bacterium 1XD42-8]